ncbi:MAG: hypothetical protein ACRDJE_01905 [Dehalococcoidia bacterium]
MLPAETRRAAARRQSDRPPCISDAGDASESPSQRHPITPRLRGPLWQVLSLVLAGGFVAAVLRGGLAGTDSRDPALRPESTTLPSRSRPAMEPVATFTSYLVSSIEDALLLKAMLDGDRAAVRVIASAEEEPAFREELRATNAIRLARGLAEIDVVDLRVVP